MDRWVPKREGDVYKVSNLGDNRCCCGYGSVCRCKRSGPDYLATVKAYAEAMIEQGARVVLQSLPESCNENVETKNLGRAVAVRMTPSVTKTVNWKIIFDE